MGTAPNTAPLNIWSRVAVDPPATPLEEGDEAPVFSYLGPEGAWHEANELFGEGPVLLVFGASESDMKALEQSRTVFTDLGVNPALVVDMRAGKAARLAKRLRLSSPIIRDPVRAIAGLYGSLDPASLHAAPAFFLVDENRVIRLVGRGALPSIAQLLASSARALNRPLPQSAWSSRG
jgi:peroxiredoxin